MGASAVVALVGSITAVLVAALTYITNRNTGKAKIVAAENTHRIEYATLQLESYRGLTETYLAEIARLTARAEAEYKRAEAAEARARKLQHLLTNRTKKD